MNEIIWREPPPPRKGKGPNKYGEALEQFRQRPNQWGVIASVDTASQANTITMYLRGGRGGAIARKEFETLYRKNDETEKYDVYVRWVGPRQLAPNKPAPSMADYAQHIETTDKLRVPAPPQPDARSEAERQGLVGG